MKETLLHIQSCAANGNVVGVKPFKEYIYKSLYILFFIPNQNKIIISIQFCDHNSWITYFIIYYFFSTYFLLELDTNSMSDIFRKPAMAIEAKNGSL